MTRYEALKIVRALAERDTLTDRQGEAFRIVDRMIHELHLPIALRERIEGSRIIVQKESK